MEFPIYDALVTDETDGIFCISLVCSPAVERNFVAFKNVNKERHTFEITNTDEHLITGVVMMADYPIYRCDGDFEYYLQFSKSTIKQMAEKMLADGTFNNISLHHNGKLLEKGDVQLVEVFIKDEAKGINPSFIDANDGSMFATFKIHNEELWNECKNGNILNGFSLEGIFEVKKQNNFNKQNKTIKMKIKEMLKKMLASFGEVATKEGTLYYEGDGELEKGIAVADADGNAIEDGEYHTEDNKTIIVKDGVVEEIKDDEAEVADEAPAEETVEEMEDEKPVAEEPAEEPAEQVDELAEIKKAIENLKADVEAIKAQLEEAVEQPVAETVAEEFKKIQKQQKFNSKIDKAIAIANALHSKI